MSQGRGSTRAKTLLAQLSRFSIAGFFNSAVGYLVIFGGTAMGMSAYLSNALGYAVGLACSFFLSKKFVFESNQSGRWQLARFLLAFALAYGLNVLCLHLLLGIEINAYTAQVLSGIVYLIFMFLLSKLWVFK